MASVPADDNEPDDPPDGYSLFYHTLPLAFDTDSPSPSSSSSRSQPHKRRQVKNACISCQKACKKCDDARPCLRCVKYGIAEECMDSQRKERKRGVKRGPYKKRDTKGAVFDPPVTPPLPAAASSSSAAPGQYSGHPPPTPHEFHPYYEPSPVPGSFYAPPIGPPSLQPPGMQFFHEYFHPDTYLDDVPDAGPCLRAYHDARGT